MLLHGSNIEVNQSSMNDRIEELYIEELEKDITKKITEKGYEVTKCKVNAQISDKEENTKITKIKLIIKKNENSSTQEENENTLDVENKIVTEIQKIKTIDTTIEKEQTDKQVNNQEDDKKNKPTKSEIQNIKKFLIEEYGVNEKCLEIN